MDYLIFSLIREGISSILILVGYKSELIIDQLLKELLESLTSLSTPVSYEIFLVNDNGLDTCWLKIKQLVKKHPQIKGLALDKNYGQTNIFR